MSQFESKRFFNSFLRSSDRQSGISIVESLVAVSVILIGITMVSQMMDNSRFGKQKDQSIRGMSRFTEFLHSYLANGMVAFWQDINTPAECGVVDDKISDVFSATSSAFGGFQILPYSVATFPAFPANSGSSPVFSASRVACNGSPLNGGTADLTNLTNFRFCLQLSPAGVRPLVSHGASLIEVTYAMLNLGSESAQTCAQFTGPALSGSRIGKFMYRINWYNQGSNPNQHVQSTMTGMFYVSPI